MQNKYSGDFVKPKLDFKKLCFTSLGILLFILAWYSPPWPDAVDPMGKHFALTREGKGALALFLLAGTWWVFEVIPIGVTSLLIGVMAEMGPISRKEILTAVIVFGCVSTLALRSFIPALDPIDKTAIILISTILFFLFGILDLNDLDELVAKIREAVGAKRPG